MALHSEVAADSDRVPLPDCPSPAQVAETHSSPDLYAYPGIIQRISSHCRNANSDPTGLYFHCFTVILFVLSMPPRSRSVGRMIAGSCFSIPSCEAESPDFCPVNHLQSHHGSASTAMRR